MGRNNLHQRAATGPTAAERLASLQEDIRASDVYREVEARERFLDRVHEVMAAQGVSRAELARRLGRGRAYVTLLLGGGRNFSFEVATQICHALGHTFMPDLRPALSDVTEEATDTNNSSDIGSTEGSSRTRNRKAVAF